MLTVPERHRGVPLIAVSSLLFALMALCARMLSGILPSHEVVLVRFLVGLGCMTGYYLATRTKPDIARPRTWVLRGVLGGGAVFFYFLAIEKLEVGPATVLNYSSPIYAGILASVFLGERLVRNVVLGIAIAWSGAMLVATATSPGSFDIGVGAASGLLSALLGGAAMTTVRSLRRDTSAGSIFLSFCIFGLIWAAPFCLRDWVTPDARALGLAVLVGLFSVAAQLLFTYAFRYVTAARGSASTQLTAVFTWLLGVFVLHESVGPQALLGAALCVGGVWLATWRRTARAAAPERSA